MNILTRCFLAAMAPLFSLGCNDRSNVGKNLDYEALTKQRATCEEPAQAQINAWGKEGLSYGCYIRHGEFIAAEGGKIRIRGHFTNGSESGKWQYFDGDGLLVKEIDYGTADGPP